MRLTSTLAGDLDRLAHRVLLGSFSGPELPWWAADRLRRGLGGICLFGSNIRDSSRFAELSVQMREAGPSCVVAVDEEGGDVTRLYREKGSQFPGHAALGAADDPDLTRAVAAGIGGQLEDVGVDLDLAPVADVNSDPRNPVIGVRSFGADPDVVARHVAAFVEGLRLGGVGACAKHFPGHGDTAVDSHLALPELDVSREVLLQRELRPFVAAVEAGVVAVMTGHLLVPAIDPEQPVTFSAAAVGLLREELGFVGLVITDALDMAGARVGLGVGEAAVAALVAGCDLLCLGADKTDADHELVVAAVCEAVRRGELPRGRLVKAASRVDAVASALRRRHRRSFRRETSDRLDRVGTVASRRVAERAVRVSGRFPPVHDAVVLRFVRESNAVVGTVPWGLPADGVVLRRGGVVDVVPGFDLAALLGALAGSSGSVVALVRDATRHADVRTALDQVAAVRPDLITVEMGWPGPERLPGAAVITTYGASRASGEALDAVLAAGAKES